MIEQSFNSQDIPTRFVDTWNRVKTKQYYLSARYNLGYNEPTLTPGDKKFVPVASLILTSRYKDQYRRFLSYDTARVTLPNGDVVGKIDTLYTNNYYKSAVDDSTRFSTFKNTLALSMREGFRDWVKFGLTVFVEHESRNFNLLDTVADGGIDTMNRLQLLVEYLANNKESIFALMQKPIWCTGRKFREFRLSGNVKQPLYCGKDAT